ncbi:hypothetical protein [Tenacibaculum sp. M341]|uniref:hypothetical protein n=1 Tax=Tenacibaculum sp. M341 TaxID=2530339 RepID=UPI0010437DE2|nr:hypothetical protein [Tenacibaculum sp. M341]TCI93043.1 hypothetical protein EYW44_05330 [Tenacibaculum sp. M341]
MKKIECDFKEDLKEELGFRIVLKPENDALKYFLLGTPIEKIAQFIKFLLNSEGGGGDEVSYLETYSNLDRGDFATGNCFNKDEVKVIHDVYGTLVLKEKLFCAIFYEFGLNVLEKNKDKKVLNNQWEKEMKEGLVKLKEKFI